MSATRYVRKNTRYVLGYAVTAAVVIIAIGTIQWLLTKPANAGTVVKPVATVDLTKIVPVSPSQINDQLLGKTMRIALSNLRADCTGIYGETDEYYETATELVLHSLVFGPVGSGNGQFGQYPNCSIESQPFRLTIGMVGNNVVMYENGQPRTDGSRSYASTLIVVGMKGCTISTSNLKGSFIRQAEC